MTTEQQTLPDDFTSYTSKLMGEELYDTFIKALGEEPPVSIRLNKLKVRKNSFLCPLRRSWRQEHGGTLGVARRQLAVCQRAYA